MSGGAAVPIPIEVADLTPEWLTHALGMPVDAVEVLAAHSGTTGRARIGIASPDPSAPASVFVKLAPFSEDRRAWVVEQGMGVAEARFYAELAEELPVRTPHVWHASHDDAGRYVMVLEDVAGATQPTQTEPDIEVFAGMVMDAFAGFHAALHGSPRFEAGGDLEWIEARRRYGSAADLVRVGVEAIDAMDVEMPPVFHAVAELYLPNADRIAALLTDGTRTLVHGDSHIGNMLRLPTGPVLLDWAVLGCAPGVRDIAYFVGTSVSTEARRAHQDEFIRRYVAAMAANGVELAYDEMFDGYRMHMITGWVAAVVTAGFGSALQPLEISMRATERANTALDELDVVPLLRAALG